MGEPGTTSSSIPMETRLVHALFPEMFAKTSHREQDWVKFVCHDVHDAYHHIEDVLVTQTKRSESSSLESYD